MKNIIRFSKIRYLMLVFSFCVIVAGLTGLYLRNGFNIGVDFTGGINKQFQIAPASFTVVYQGPGQAELNIYGGRIEVSFFRRL